MPFKYGMGQPSDGITFAFMRKIKTGLYEGIMPFTTCKDYLNDVLRTEQVNPSNYTHSGLAYSKTNFLNKDINYIAISFKGDDSKKKNLDTNIKKLQILIHDFEDMLDIKKHIKIEISDTGQHLLTYDAKWNKECYTMSLLAQLIRTAVLWDFKGSFFEFVQDTDISHKDIDYMRTVIKKEGRLNFLIENGFVKQKYPKVAQMIHSHGIVYGDIIGFND